MSIDRITIIAWCLTKIGVAITGAIVSPADLSGLPSLFVAFFLTRDSVYRAHHELIALGAEPQP